MAQIGITKKLEQIYNFIVANSIATENEVSLVTCISGWDLESFNAIIYQRTAYHDVEQLWDCERDSYDFSMISFLENDEEEEGEEEEKNR